jgi:hypothetical protein
MQFKLLLSGICLGLSTSLMALPTLYPNDPIAYRNIVNNTTSNIVADYQDTKVVYVMPPNTASAFVSGFQGYTADIGFCREMSNLQNYSSSLSDRMGKILIEHAEEEEKIEAAQAAYQAARLEMADAVAGTQASDILSLDDLLVSVSNRVAEITEQLNECSDHCHVLVSEHRDLSAQRRQLMSERRDLARVARREVQKYEQAKRRAEAHQENLKYLEERVVSRLQLLQTTRGTLIGMYDHLANRNGIVASIDFRSDWTRNVQQLRDENPGYQFKKIETQNARVSTNIPTLEGIPSGGAIKGFYFPAPFEENQLVLQAYPDEIQGNIQLSLLGTCPLIHPEYFGLTDEDVNNDRMRFGITISYEYPTVFEANVVMSYNMYKMYEVIQTQHSRGGGFFRRRVTTSDRQEKEIFKDSFKTTWKGASHIPAEKRESLETEMRSRVIERMANLSTP